MDDMGQTFTGKLVDVSKTTVRNNKGWTISGTTLVAVTVFLFNYGGTLLDFVVSNSRVFEIHEIDISQLQMENRILLAEIKHSRHIVGSQNFILQRMLDSGLINSSEAFSMHHAVDHNGRDSS